MFGDARNRQIEENECGLACLAHAAALAGSNLDLRWFRQSWPPPAAGLTLLELERVAKAVGFATEVIECRSDDLTRLALPCVMLWNRHHFVLLERLGPKRVDVFDPARGPRRLEWDEVAERFGGGILQLTATSAMPRMGRDRSWLTCLQQIDLGVSVALLAGLGISLLFLLFAYIAWPIYVGRTLVEGSRVLPACLLVGSIHSAAIIWRRLLLIQARRDIAISVGQRVFGALTGAPLNWLMRRRPTDLIARVDFASLLEPLSEGTAAAAADAGLALLAVLCLADMSVACALVTMAGFFTRLSFQAATLRVSARLAGELQRALGRERVVLRETFDALRTMRAGGLEASRVSAWRLAAASRLSTILADAHWRLRLQIADGMLTLGILALCALIAKGTPDWHRSIVVLLAGAHLQYRASGLFAALLTCDDLIVKAWRIADRAPPNPTVADGPPAKNGPLELVGVTHSLSAADPVLLHRTHLTVSTREFVAITGPMGCDLSAIALLMSGLMPPLSGVVSFGGRDLSKISASERQRTVGLLLEQDALFRGSIAQNLGQFREADPARVWRALELVGLTDKVRSLPEGLETPVGSPYLKPAHRRALQVARTLFDDPALLVLDQPTRGLDPAGRDALFATLRSSCATRAVLTRDPELMALADRVLVYRRSRLWNVPYGGSDRAATPSRRPSALFAQSVTHDVE